jgi:hypothetical protein
MRGQEKYIFVILCIVARKMRALKGSYAAADKIAHRASERAAF